MTQAARAPLRSGRTVLVTGVTGFAGGHLAQALLERGDRVVGLSRSGRWPPQWAHFQGRSTLYACDLGSRAEVADLLREFGPEQVYHLAGYANSGRSVREPDQAWRDNLQATRELYEAVLLWGGKPRLLFVGSGQVYGDAEPGRAHDESCLLRPASPYAASKAAADLASIQYGRTHGLDILRARPFNHIGPGQSSDYAVAHFARQVAAIEGGRQPPLLRTGNLSACRDLTDVRDTVAAYLLLMEHGRAGEAYNVASGQTHSMRQVLESLLRLAGLEERVQVEQQSDLLRPADLAVAGVDATKLRRETGWQPRFPLEQTLADTLDYWRSRP